MEGAQVTLDGSDSFDPDGMSLSYVWEQTSGPEVTFSNPNSIHCTFIALTGVGQYGEIYIFQLTVTDNGGFQAKDTVNIHVIKEDYNEAPVAYAGTVQMVTEGESVTLDGSAEPEDTIISWSWEQTEGPDVALSDSTIQKPEFTAPEVWWEGESLIFELTVTDDTDTFQEDSDKVIVNVIDSDPNDRHLPLVAHAGPDQNVDEGSYVTLNGSATDPNGALDNDPNTSYEWEQISGISVNLSGTGKNRSFTAPDVQEPEELIFRLIVSDKYGLKSDDRITIKVEWINDWPVAEARLDPNITIEEGLKVQLDGANSYDSDDGIASYLWEQISGPKVILSSDTIVKPIFIVPKVLSNDQLIFRLTVADKSNRCRQERE
jgi:hypothetical protein